MATHGQGYIKGRQCEIQRDKEPRDPAMATHRRGAYDGRQSETRHSDRLALQDGWWTRLLCLRKSHSAFDRFLLKFPVRYAYSQVDMLSNYLDVNILLVDAEPHE